MKCPAGGSCFDLGCVLGGCQGELVPAATGRGGETEPPPPRGSRRLRAGRWLRYLLIGLGLSMAIAADAQVDEGRKVQIRCMQGMCVVPMAVLEELAKGAALAEEYARLCGWVKP